MLYRIRFLALILGLIPCTALAGTYTEDFTTTTFKDTVNTTADWNTVDGELKLFPFSPAVVGSVNTPGNARALAVAGNRVFVTDASAGLQVVDITDPTSPTIIGTYGPANNVQDVALFGNYAYLADGTPGLLVVDISDPTSPTLAGSYNPITTPDKVAVFGNLAVIGVGSSGIEVLDLSTPTSPSLLGSFNTSGTVADLEIDGDLVFVADATSGLQIVDISNPASPTLRGSFNTPGIALGISVDGNLAYVADGASGLQIIDITDPANPQLAGSIDTPGTASKLVAGGDRVYVADGSEGLQVIDVTDPANPAIPFAVDTPGTASGVDKSSTHAFIVNSGVGLTPELGLNVVRIGQDELDTLNNTGRSLPVDGQDRTILRARITSSQTAGVTWELSADGGSNFQAFVPGANWVDFVNPGSDLLWRATLDQTAPGTNPTVSALVIQWEEEPFASVLTSFASLDAAECCPGGNPVVPPSPSLAVGPDHLVAAVNQSLEIFDKTGTTLFGPTTLIDFFSSLSLGTLSTPSVVYDESADRFAIGVADNEAGYYLAISMTADPTGGWWFHEAMAPVGLGHYFDRAIMTVGTDGLFLGTVFVDGFANLTNRVYAFDKMSLYAGGGPNTRPRDLGTDDYFPWPMMVRGFNQGTWPIHNRHYILTDQFDLQNYRIWVWDGPFQGPDSLWLAHELDLPALMGEAPPSPPVDSRQLGTSTTLAGNRRTMDFEFRNGFGWTTMAVASEDSSGNLVNCVRWAQLDLDTGALGPQGAAITCTDGRIPSVREYALAPNLAVNHCGDMAVGYTLTGTERYPSIWLAGRQATDPAGTLQPGIELKAGEDLYSAFDGSPYRWGDQTTMTLDPDGVTFWYMGEYAGTFNPNWATWIGSFQFPCDAPVVSVPEPTPDPSPGAAVTLGARPNPMHGSAAFYYSVPTSGPVAIAVYDVRGRVVRQLVDEVMTVGDHQVRWDGRTEAGTPVASGTYFVRLQAGGISEARTIVLIR